MSIKAILYSIFDPLEGPKILHQVPEGSVLTQTDAAISSTGNLNNSALVAFSTISRILIPRQSLCGNLISLAPPPLHPGAPPILVLSHPVCIQSTHYRRNEFIFNFALVLSSPDTIDVPSYKSVLTKLAHLMQSLEEQSYFLSDDSSAPGTGKIYNLCEMLMEDLNNYCECMIPIDDFNTLNIKLFPTLPNPVRVRAWHVPLFTVRIETLMDQNWDLTMQRIIPFINGINSVSRIAGLADADLKLTKKCIRHLLYYGCVLLLDIFSFGAIYAPTADFTSMIASDTEMQAECARYVNSTFEPTRQDAVVLVGGEAVSSSMRSSNLGNISAIGPMLDEEIWPRTANDELVDGVGIVQLFANLSQGLTVKEWYAQNSIMLAHIDVRRFITFGIIKGFLYRVHKYAIQTVARTQAKSGLRNPSQKDTTRATQQKKHQGESEEEDEEVDEDARLQKQLTSYLDGTHCFDEICTGLCISEQELVRRLNQPGLFCFVQAKSLPVPSIEVFRNQCEMILVYQVYAFQMFTANSITKAMTNAGFQGGIHHCFNILGSVIQALPDFFKENNYQDIADMTKTPFQAAFKIDMPAFIRVQTRPDNFAHFNRWMAASPTCMPTWLDAYPHRPFAESLKPDQVFFVDIGGGIGHQSIALREIYPDLRNEIVLQDIPATLQHAIPHPGVKVAVQEFWQPQEIKEAKIYYMRNIVHVYPDDKAISILENTKDVLGPNCVILVDEMVIPNRGGHWQATQLDIIMMSAMGSTERTQDQWYLLIERAGLKISKIYTYTTSHQDSIIENLGQSHYGRN